MEYVPRLQRGHLEPAAQVNIASMGTKKNSEQRSRPKHHHWVPQFYLRYYATPETRGTDQPQVWIFSKHESDGDEKLTNVRNVCGKRYLYAPQTQSGERDWALDDLITGLEDTLSRIWPDLVESRVSIEDRDLRKGLALFVAVMYLRNPRVRAETEQMHAQIVKAFESMPFPSDSGPNTVEVEAKGKKYTLSTDGWSEYQAWGKDEHDRFFCDFVRSEAVRLAEHFLKKRWAIVFAHQETFITTDNPVCLQHETRDRYGVETEGTIITFPLSPTRILVMDDLHSELANRYYPLAEGSGAAFNAVLWHKASRFLITGRPVPEVLEEIQDLA